MRLWNNFAEFVELVDENVQQIGSLIASQVVTSFGEVVERVDEVKELAVEHFWDFVEHFARSERF